MFYLWLLLIGLLVEILGSFKDSSNVLYTPKNFHRKDKPKIFFHNGYFLINSTSRFLWCQYFPQTIHKSFYEGWPLLTYNETWGLHVPWANKHVEIKSCTRNSLKLFVSNIKLKTSIACVPQGCRVCLRCWMNSLSSVHLYKHSSILSRFWLPQVSSFWSSCSSPLVNIAHSFGSI